jgi:hypothetical protein
MLRQIYRLHDHARRAEPTLKRMAITKSCLHGMQVFDTAQTFNGQNFAFVGLHREHCTRLYRCTIEMDGACPTLRGITSDVGAG